MKKNNKTLKQLSKKNIFIKSLSRNAQIVPLNTKVAQVGKIKYLPSFSKEWSNTIYSYNKNTLKNLPSNYSNLNKIIQSYFNLYFQDSKFVGSKFVSVKKRRNFLRRIYVSNAEIKHTNSKAIITLFTFNKEKKVLFQKFNIISKRLLNLYSTLYKNLYRNNLKKIHQILSGNNTVLFAPAKIDKKTYIQSKLNYLQKFLTLKNLLMQKLWISLITKVWKTQLRIIRKYQLLYSLNENKFNNNVLLPKLSNLLTKLLNNKKVEYNIINLKSITFHTDLFTQFLALKLKNTKSVKPSMPLDEILNEIQIPNVEDKTTLYSKYDTFVNKYADLKIATNLQEGNLEELLKENETSKDIHSSIFDSIKYKHTRGMKLQVKGRLTKRSRADRALQVVRFQGGLKNIDSSFQGLNTVLYRGNAKANVTYSVVNSKRNLGAFAIKGWVGTK